VTAAGPYYYAAWGRNRRIVLKRNPYYRGPRPHRVRSIEVDVGLPLETIKLNIDRNVTDAGDIPPAAHAELGKRYGARRRSPGRYFVNPSTTIFYLALNHDSPLFGGPTPLGNVRLKQAVNFAIDRQAIAQQLGAYGATPTDQLLPPGIRGYRDVPIYPRRPNMRRARELAVGNLRQGNASFYCSNRAPAPQQCQVAQANLKEMGLDVDIRLYSSMPLYPPTGLDMYWAQWHADAFDAYNFLFFISGKSFTRAPTDVNLSHFNASAINRRIERANLLNGVARYRAFSALDHDIVRDAAPVAVLGTPNDRHYVSARVGCYRYQPVFGLDLPALCLNR
jgi:oligopeptide transport system substrate-binding protein